jgi:hypothetical protein
MCRYRLDVQHRFARAHATLGRRSHFQTDDCACRWHRRCQLDEAETSVRRRFFCSSDNSLTCLYFSRWGLERKAQWQSTQSARLGKRRHHFSGLPEHGCRLIGLVMKQCAQRKRDRPGPARGYDDPDAGPSLGDTTSQVSSAHRAGHTHVREKQPNVLVCLEQSQGLVGVPGFEHPVSCIQEHARGAHALEHVVIDDNYHEGFGGELCHWRQRSLITMVPCSSTVPTTLRAGLCPAG